MIPNGSSFTGNLITMLRLLKNVRFSAAIPHGGGGSYMVKWQGCSSYLLGFEIPIFGIF